jgi:hypothetical protein
MKKTNIAFLFWRIDACLLTIEDYHHFQEQGRAHSLYSSQSIALAHHQLAGYYQEMQDIPFEELLAYIHRNHERIARFSPVNEVGSRTRMAQTIIKDNYQRARQLLAKRTSSSLVYPPQDEWSARINQALRIEAEKMNSGI